ncbi:1-phosphatidylinositol phosphodiesterase [Streptomyces inusitatus]|uniref:1-phosphatidylinositol phosphodiesterase n=1 Tax=Streptomyces inusitatus TaxID=68221 RepID=A0A918V0D2_9ACTN|nr:1-phosphatidylinositol phosphodiesterase [Streptomyces inusitatus]
MTVTAAATALPLSAAKAQPISAQGTHNWMSRFPGATLLRNLTIPGTHDSGARFGSVWHQCQGMTITQQLNAGIRFLDIRCRAIDGVFAIHHGNAFQNAMFGNVLSECWDFLKANPGETVLMRVKQEYSEESDAVFGAIFEKYYQDWKAILRVGNGLPPLGTARGKVVILGDNGGIRGVRYGDSSLFDIQDDWNALGATKSDLIKNHLRKARNQPGKLFINYVSSAAWNGTPSGHASSLNHVLNGVLTGEAASWRALGAIMMDYPENKPDLIQNIINRN